MCSNLVNPPLIKVLPEENELTVKEGETLVISCKVTAIPQVGGVSGCVKAQSSKYARSLIVCSLTITRALYARSNLDTEDYGDWSVGECHRVSEAKVRTLVVCALSLSRAL